MKAHGEEIRIGLVLYGGVSLAVYIYGVVIEVQRLLAAAAELEDGKKDSAYAKALDESGASAVTVDIIAGTSAGGINGILLAKALARQADVETARELWVESGDIGQLLQLPSTRDPRSLLQSSRFERAVRKGLAQFDREAGRGPTKEAPILDLFVSATHLRGGHRIFTDSLGAEVGTRQYRYVFRLKLRRRQPDAEGAQGYERDDFEQNERLIRLSRATSAFPVAFEPMLIPKADELFAHPEDGDAWFADGGILNNKPFSEAVDAIVSRRSDRPVRRWLFSLDPDPVLLEPENGAGEAPAFDQVALRSVATIPRYQSIARDLMALREHNERVDAAEAAVLAEEARLAGEEGAAEPGGEEDEGERPQGAYRTMRFQALAKEVADGLVEVSARTEERDQNSGQPDWLEVHRAFRLGVEQVLARDDGQPDLAFERRRVYYLIKLLGMAEEVEEGDPGRAREALWVEFEAISDELWHAFGAYPVSDAALPFVERVAEARDAFVFSKGRLGARRARQETGSEDEDALLRALTPVVLKMRSGGFPFPVRLREVYEHFERRDPVLLAAELYGDLDRRDRIRHAQISPLDTGNTGVDPDKKVAGASLGHFGGFLDAGWRRNDIMWGRLDGAEVLMRAILEARDQNDPELRELTDAVQVEILERELPEVVNGPLGWKAALQAHMGPKGPTLGDLDAGVLTRLGLRAAGVLRRMLQTAARDSAGGGRFDRARAFVLRSLANLLGFGVALVYLPLTAFLGESGLARRLAALALLVPLAWGLATLVLGLLGAFSLADVKWAVVVAIGIYPAALLAWWVLGPVRRLVARLRRRRQSRRQRRSSSAPE